MSKNLIYLCSFVLALGLILTGPTHAQDPNLMGWWKLDGDALDSSGNDRHGTLRGAPQYVPGAVNEALEFNGSADYVNIDGYQGVLGTHAWSAGAWIRASGTTDHRSCLGWGNNVNLQRIEIRLLNGSNILRANHGAGNANTQTALAVDEWYHFVLTVQENATCSYPDMIFYLNGVDDTVPNTDPDLLDIVANADLSIGRRASHGDRYWAGSIDEVVLYDKVLTPEEVLRVLEGDILPATELAGNEDPADEAVDLLRDAVLTWSPGKFVTTHNVYLGTVFEDVNNASVAEPLGVTVSEGQDDNSLAAGVLEFGQTYYWRVDEVNGAPDFTVYKGDVWTFTIEPVSIPITHIMATASSEFGASVADKTIDGSGLTGDLHGTAAPDMWISTGIPATIEYAFDRAYKLHEMWIWNSNQAIEAFIGFGAKDVVIEHSLDGDNWTVLDGVGPLAQAPGIEGYAHNNTIDFGGAKAQHVRMSITTVQGFAPQASLSEVRFLYIPTFATGPNPLSGATDVSADVTLSWARDGREAAGHDIYLGADPNALSLAGSVTESSFDSLAADLQLGQTYYWQVVEVNDAMDPSEWAGAIWSFTTVETILVDDMESYRDEEFLEIWATWIDGFDDPANGSLVGNGAAGAPETDRVHGGSQSLPLHYDNSAAAQSEATRTFDVPMDWTGHGVASLVLYFQGSATNTGGSLYVKINDTKIAYDGDASNLMRLGWNKWTIILAEAGANLSRVNSLTVGVDSGGMGVVTIDDIQLTSDGARDLITPVEPVEGLVVYYPLDGDYQDASGNGLHGTPMGGPFFEAGQSGQAVSLNGIDQYVEITGYQGITVVNGVQQPFTVTNWFKTTENGEMVTWGASPDGQRLSWRLDGGSLRTEHGSGNLRGNTVANDGEWHHAALVVTEGATLRPNATQLYLDGLEDSTFSGADVLYNLQPDTDVSIGRRATSGDRYFPGSLDDVRIYDRDLTDAEIAWLAGRTKAFDK